MDDTENTLGHAEKLNRRITVMQSFSRVDFCRFSVLVSAFMLLAGCSPKHDEVDDLAVSKMPTDMMQATSYLPLNPDKPGTPVDVQRYLVPGKYTLVEFFSPYDGPSMSLEPQLMQLAQNNRNVSVRTVNINRPGVQGIDWQSPIVEAAQIQSLPYFVIYDPRQALRAKGRPAYEQVRQWVQ